METGKHLGPGVKGPDHLWDVDTGASGQAKGLAVDGTCNFDRARCLDCA